MAEKLLKKLICLPLYYPGSSTIKQHTLLIGDIALSLSSREFLLQLSSGFYLTVMASLILFY